MNVPEKYLENINAIINAVRDSFSKGETPPPVVFLGNDKECFPCIMDMSSEMAKTISAMLARYTAQLFDAEYAIMVSEVWSLGGEKLSQTEIQDYLKTHDGIAEHPDRIDSLMITLETLEGYWLGQTEIKTSADGKKSFDEIEFKFLIKAGGRFTCFLPRRPAH